MKLSKHKGDQWQYVLKQEEAEVLRALLKNFPFTKMDPVNMSKGRHDAEMLEREALLNESLTAHRNGLKLAAEKLVNDSLCKSADGWLLTVKMESKETLLQILNDIRIGAWRELGEPDDIHQPPDSPAKLQNWSLINLAGYFEECLIGE